MPASIIVPGGGECSSKRHRVQSSLGTCSPSPECSESSIMTESILTTSHVTMTSLAPSEDFFSDSSLIFVPSEKKKSTRETPSKKVPEVWQFGSTDIRYRNCEVKNAAKDQNATKDPELATLKNHMRGTDYTKPEKQLAKQRKQMGDSNADDNGLQGYKVGPLEMAELKDDQEDSSREVLNIDQVAEKRDQKAEAMLHTRMVDDAISGEEPSHSSWRIPPVVCSAQVPTRSQDSDIVARAIRSLLWESPSQPPSIVTPSSLHLIRREGDMLETAVETLLDQKKIGLSIEGMDLGRKGELKFLVISYHLGTGTEEEQVMMAARNCLYLPALSSIQLVTTM